MGTVSFPGVNSPGHGVNHTPPSSADVKERVELYINSLLSGFMLCYRMNFTFWYRWLSRFTLCTSTTNHIITIHPLLCNNFLVFYSILRRLKKNGYVLVRLFSCFNPGQYVVYLMFIFSFIIDNYIVVSRLTLWCLWVPT